nr:hypothetical protein GCM10020241_64510 [Streptoalloteichus tenebrarius]
MVAESVFALNQFVRGATTSFQSWRRRVRGLLDATVAEELTGRNRPHLEDLLRLLERHPDRQDADDRVRDPLAATVFEFGQVAVTPYWDRVRSHLESVRDVLGRVAITNGVEGLLDTLHPKLHWDSPVLTVPDAADRDVHLNGRGLLLSPSVFLSGRPCVFLEAERSGGRPALVFSAPTDPALTQELWGDEEPRDHALEALVGHTRAAALQALTESCTTGELSQRLGISVAGASKHATVLRKAGLVMTARSRNNVLHSLTELGVALLQNRGAALPRPRQPELT